MSDVDTELDALKSLVLAKYLSGVCGSTTIAAALGEPKLEPLVAKIIQKAEFQVAVRNARRDMSTSVVDTIKQRLHLYREKMEDLALAAGDPRVQFQALKDLLDRGGTGAAKQIALTSPAAYKKTLEEFMETPDEAPSEPAADPGPDAPSGK